MSGYCKTVCGHCLHGDPVDALSSTRVRVLQVRSGDIQHGHEVDALSSTRVRVLQASWMKFPATAVIRCIEFDPCQGTASCVHRVAIELLVDDALSSTRVRVLQGLLARLTLYGSVDALSSTRVMVLQGGSHLSPMPIPTGCIEFDPCQGTARPVRPQ